MKRRRLLVQMASIARSYGVEFDGSHAVHGRNHDRYVVGKQSVEVPRHKEVVEYTARGILRTFEQLCMEAKRHADDDA
jgi:hypothetical protein